MEIPKRQTNAIVSGLEFADRLPWQPTKQDPGTRRQIYLLGNPIIYWMCLFAPPLYLVIGSILAVRARRGYCDMDTYRMGRWATSTFVGDGGA